MSPALLLLACGGFLFGKGDGDVDDSAADGGSAYLDEDAFAQAYADALCTWWQDCGTLTDVYETIDECLSIEEANLLAWVEQSACDYDASAAAECVASWDQVACEEAGQGWPADSPCHAVCEEDGGI